MGHYGHVHFRKTPIDFCTSSFKNVHADGYWAVDAYQQLHFEDTGRCGRCLCRALGKAMFWMKAFNQAVITVPGGLTISSFEPFGRANMRFHGWCCNKSPNDEATPLKLIE